MTKNNKKIQPGKDALSQARIVEAAIEILDAGGEVALTFRALTTRLATGSGAIYWHVANKDELLAAATNGVVTQAMNRVDRTVAPRAAIRAVASGFFDVLDAHPWVGTQLSRAPWDSAVLQIFERVGEQFQALGVPEEMQFHCAAAVVNYVLGLAGQYAAVARVMTLETNRSAFLEQVAAQWTQLDPAAYPFVHRVAAEFREHDEREQFLAGIDLILAGITTLEETLLGTSLPRLGARQP
jgi:AcrR family transcriptional regulator